MIQSAKDLGDCPQDEKSTSITENNNIFLVEVSGYI